MLKQLTWASMTSLLAFLLLGANGHSQETGMDSAARKYPASTVALLHSSDFPSFLKQFAETGPGQALLKTPSLEVLDFAVRQMQDAEDSLVKGVVFDEEDLSDVASRFFTGEFEFAILELDDQFHWVASIGYDPEAEVIQAFKKKIVDDNQFGVLKFKKPDTDETDEETTAEDTSIQGQFSFKQQDVFTNQKPDVLNVRIKSDSFDFASDARIFELIGQDTIEFKKSLVSSRRFKQVARNCEFGSANDELSCYVNLTEILKRAFDKEGKTAVIDTGILDLLTLGVRLEVGRGNCDFRADAYVTHALPREGINKVLKLSPLLEPVNGDVSNDVDFYGNSKIDLNELVAGINSLDNTKQFGRQAKFSRGLTVVAPLLAQICQADKKKLKLECFTGQFDFSGSVRDNGYSSNVVLSNRLATNDTPEPNLLGTFHNSIPGAARALILKDFGGMPYLTWSDELLRQVQKTVDKSKEDGVDTSKIMIEPQSWAVNNDFLGAWSHASYMKKVFEESPDELLADNANVDRVWRQLTKDSAPGMFVFIKGPEFFRPLYVWLRMKSIGASDWASFRKQKLEDKGQRNSPEYRIRSRIVDSVSAWSYEDFGSSFGPGGLAVYQRDQGFLIRMIQLKKDE